ncbi:MAG TPA: hypothetical protein VKA19_07500 [Alphaproteobacteria bacterium]|nr:hypothetical protein [Alphaproteobacteria bacterium]
MAWTQDEIDALEDALKSGALRVEIGGKVLHYRSVDEIERTLQRARESAGTTKPSDSRRYAVYSKGLD